MPKEVAITDEELKGFSPQAAIDLEKSIADYKNDLLKEIGRIEAGQNAGSGFPEITSRMIKEAEMIFSRGTIYHNKKNGMKALKIFSVISLFTAGAMVQKDYLTDFRYLIAFLVVVSLAIFTNVMVHLRE